MDAIASMASDEGRRSRSPKRHASPTQHRDLEDSEEEAEEEDARDLGQLIDLLELRNGSGQPTKKKQRHKKQTPDTNILQVRRTGRPSHSKPQNKSTTAVCSLTTSVQMSMMNMTSTSDPDVTDLPVTSTRKPETLPSVEEDEVEEENEDYDACKAVEGHIEEAFFDCRSEEEFTRRCSRLNQKRYFVRYTPNNGKQYTLTVDDDHSQAVLRAAKYVKCGHETAKDPRTIYYTCEDYVIVDDKDPLPPHAVFKKTGDQRRQQRMLDSRIKNIDFDTADGLQEAIGHDWFCRLMCWRGSAILVPSLVQFVDQDDLVSSTTVPDAPESKDVAVWIWIEGSSVLKIPADSVTPIVPKTSARINEEVKKLKEAWTEMIEFVPRKLLLSHETLLGLVGTQSSITWNERGKEDICNVLLSKTHGVKGNRFCFEVVDLLAEMMAKYAVYLRSIEEMRDINSQKERLMSKLYLVFTTGHTKDYTDLSMRWAELLEVFCTHYKLDSSQYDEAYLDLDQEPTGQVPTGQVPTGQESDNVTNRTSMGQRQECTLLSIMSPAKTQAQTKQYHTRKYAADCSDDCLFKRYVMNNEMYMRFGGPVIPLQKQKKQKNEYVLVRFCGVQRPLKIKTAVFAESNQKKVNKLIKDIRKHVKDCHNETIEVGSNVRYLQRIKGGAQVMAFRIKGAWWDQHCMPGFETANLEREETLRRMVYCQVCNSFDGELVTCGRCWNAWHASCPGMSDCRICKACTTNKKK